MFQVHKIGQGTSQQVCVNLHLYLWRVKEGNQHWSVGTDVVQIDLGRQLNWSCSTSRILQSLQLKCLSIHDQQQPNNNALFKFDVQVLPPNPRIRYIFQEDYHIE